MGEKHVAKIERRIADGYEERVKWLREREAYI
jgi:hypothetical protein